eukprot:5599139-Pleurochrysis_carterae.AAC.3
MMTQRNVLQTQQTLRTPASKLCHAQCHECKEHHSACRAHLWPGSRTCMSTFPARRLLDPLQGSKSPKPQNRHGSLPPALQPTGGATERHAESNSQVSSTLSVQIPGPQTAGADGGGVDGGGGDGGGGQGGGGDGGGGEGGGGDGGGGDGGGGDGGGGEGGGGDGG